MSIRLHKVSKELNVGLNTIVSICNQYNIEVEPSLNSKISDEEFELIKDVLFSRPLRILPWYAEPFTDDGETNRRIVNSHGWNTLKNDLFVHWNNKLLLFKKNFSEGNISYWNIDDINTKTPDALVENGVFLKKLCERSGIIPVSADATGSENHTLIASTIPAISKSNFSLGDTIHVKISNIVETIGAFVKMPNGYDGLIRTTDFAWFNQSSILKSFSIGEELDVIVIKVLPDGKVNLSRKELLPNPKTLEKGLIFKCTIKRKEAFGLIVQLGDFTALIHKNELPHFSYIEGEEITCVVIDNVFDSEKHYNKISMSILALHNHIAKQHNDNDIVKCIYRGSIVENDCVIAIVELDSLVMLHVPEKRFIEPYSSDLLNNRLQVGIELSFTFSYDEEKRTIKLDMRPIERKRKKEEKERLLSQLHKGDIVEAEVLSVNDRNAKILISNTNSEFEIPREELSPNKVLRASDEVFVGEHIHVAYLGEESEVTFSRRFFVKDMYEESLYELSQEDLLATMGLSTNKFVGKIIEIKSDYFITNLMTVGQTDDEQNGNLLIDPINGKNLIAIVDRKLKKFFVVGEYYEVELELARKEYRQSSGTPYMFSVVSNNIRESHDPYMESVLQSFKHQLSPDSNTSLANLLEEVGDNLYSSKERMFFELLQNADDAASKNGVNVKIELTAPYFVLTHNGYAFNQHDFESITSAAKSTKRTSNKKTGYKGIGFKSVFTNSHSVYITSGGYSFAFDRDYPMFNSFEDFYFLANEIEDDPERQADFLKKFSKQRREFRDVRDIPWQLLPIWADNKEIEKRNSIFSSKENVSIALKMDEDKLNEYYKAIKKVFKEPRFMLFLRKTNRVQLLDGNECLTIKKNTSDDEKIISLVNSFDTENRVENYKINTFEQIPVNDDAFATSGISIKREARINSKGENENYLARIDCNGYILGEVTGIPDRIASTKDTTISFAIKIDTDGHICPLERETLSLYAYLPMNEHRFKFPFYVNADFIPKSDREGVQSDNPWNHFIFYTIGKSIVKMVASFASEDEPEYLNLLPTEEFKSSSQDTAALVDSFNRGYKEALRLEQFIINDKKELVYSKDIIFDASGLSDAVGADAFYKLVGTSKRLPNSNINTNCLSKTLFEVEICTVDAIYNILSVNNSTLSEWIQTCSDSQRTAFYNWMVSDDKLKTWLCSVPLFMFGEQWKTMNQISINDKCLIQTEKIAPIKDVLVKLGFIISNEFIENHPLYAYITPQDEKSIFHKIQEVGISGLTFHERLTLFQGCANLEEVGKETLKKWSVFKNQNNEFVPLLNMFAYNNSCPSWLNSYMLNFAESNIFLNSYLIPQDEIYSSVIENKIDEILTKTDILQVYNIFRTSWNSGFTAKLFSKPCIPAISMITLVEQSDDSTKANYVRTFKQLELNSSSTYDSSSFDYRWMKLAALEDSTINHARSVVTIDGNSLSSYTIKDELSITYNGVVYKFLLSKLLPSYSSTSVLSHVVEQFETIERYNEIFAQSEAAVVDVRNKLYNELRVSRSYITEEQYCFLMLYRMSQGYQYFDNSLKSVIRANSEPVFTNILQKCYVSGLGENLGAFVKNGGIVYPFTSLIGTYFNSDDYTLPSERIPDFVNRWADTLEKKQFLIHMGLHYEKSIEITRRKSFKEKKNENVWNINDVSIIRTFLRWVCQSFTLPITDEIQVGILETLFSVLRISGVYNYQDFGSAKEWTNDLYLEWKKDKQIKIYVIDGKLPYRGIFENNHLFNGYTGEYTYFSDINTIYISSNREPASILADVYANRNIPFTKDDWNQIFLVSADIVKEKDLRIAELERMLEEAKNRTHYRDDNDEYEDDHDNASERGTLDVETRVELNLEARNAAKDYLDSLEDYDCSDWDPNIGNGLVKGIVKYKNKTITVVVTSSIGRKLYLHPRLFSELMIDPDNLLLNYGYDRRIHRISFDETFKDNQDVNLIFDSKIITPEEFAYLANRYKYSKKTCFVIENIMYSISEQIKGFGLDEKMSDSDVYTNIDTDELFDF